MRRYSPHLHPYSVIVVGFFVAAALFLFTNRQVRATNYTFAPEADAFVRAGDAGSNYGSQTILRSATDMTSYLRFDVPHDDFWLRRRQSPHYDYRSPKQYGSLRI